MLGKGIWHRRLRDGLCWRLFSLLLLWCCVCCRTEGQPLPLVPAKAPDPLHIFSLIVQLGGDDARATQGLLAAALNTVIEELACPSGTCTITDAWNVSTCLDGAPVPAPQVSFAHQDAGVFTELRRAAAPTPAPSSIVSSIKPQSQTHGAGRRRLSQALTIAEQQDLQSAVVPASARPCTPQVDIAFSFNFANSEEADKLNQTKTLFMSGVFLAQMQALKNRLEQVQLVNLTGHGDHGNAPGDPPSAGGMNQSGLFVLNQPDQPTTVTTSVTFGLELIGPDAQVTNDTVLQALYDMIVDPTVNGGGPWLVPPNTAIIDVKQGPLQNVTLAPAGRRLLSLHLSSRMRRLAQMGGPNALNSGQQPSIYVTTKVQNVQFTDVSSVKESVNTLASGNQLVNGFELRGIGIDQVDLASFNFQPASAPRPASSPPLVGPPRSTHHTMVVIVLSIVVPVTVVGAVIIACSIVYWGRISQRKSGYHSPGQSTAYSYKGGGLHSETSLEGLGVLPLGSGTKFKHAHSQSFSQNRLMDMPWSDWKIEPSELTILTKPDGMEWQLGSGASGTVYKALRNGVQIVAVKMFKEEVTRGAINSLNSWHHAAQFRKEISILKSCHDRNIVQFVGACLAEGQTSLVTEFLENGDLYRAINSPQGGRYHWYRMQTPDGKPVPNSGMARRVALDVARGLHFLHTRKIVHFDLKSANILLARDFTAKIADVGLAKILHEDVLSTRREVGTFAWAAPEVLLGQPTTESADIYSFGVLLHELSAQESPRNRQLRRLSVPEEVPPDVHDLIIWCLDIVPEKRPTARQLVAKLTNMPAVAPFPPSGTPPADQALPVSQSQRPVSTFNIDRM